MNGFKLSAPWAWFVGFAGVFAVLASFVFWGTWSMDVAPVMPDNAITHPAFYLDVLTAWWRGVLSTGKVLPSDLVWNGLLISPYFCQELKYAVGVFCAAVGLVYFLRGRGLSRLAAYGAGLSLAFCGYWLTLFSAGHAGWFMWMTYGVFAFGLVDRAVRGNQPRHWLLLGLAVSWAGFNQQDLWLLFSVFTAFYFAWCCVRERVFPWKGALVALAAFLLVGLPNFKDTIQHTLKGRIEQMEKGENVTQKDADAVDRRWEFVTNWSMPPEDTREFFTARAQGDTSCPFVLSINGGKGVRPYTGALGRPMNAAQGNYRQHSLYVGKVTCLLALLGLLFAVLPVRRSTDSADRRIGDSRDALFFAGAAVVCYAFSLGRYFEPAYRVIFALPFGDLIRCPVKWHHLTEFCLVVLAGYGIEGLLARFGRMGRMGRWAPWAIGLLVLAGTFNLAGEARRFCAPVNVGPARRSNSTMQLTVLPRSEFQKPQIAGMVQAGRIVSVAHYLGNPDYFLVGVLEPYKSGETQTDWTAVLLGLVSWVTVGGIGYMCKMGNRVALGRRL